MFKLEEPLIADGKEIGAKSLEIVEKEAYGYPKFSEFTKEQREVIKRQIHTTTCFAQILDNIYFSPNAIEKLKSLLEAKASIVVDTNMIKTGLSDFYTSKHKNSVICYVNEESIYEEAKNLGTTRSYAAVKRAIEEDGERGLILACGNAPTFLYAAINTLIKSGRRMDNVAILAFPVGFVNVTESKEYTRSFMDYYGVEGIVINGGYGASTLVVSALHAIYKLI
ncbi:MAG TPA: precorrin-8X methylmutase [Campylobacterales bacterium]|nr:precorrin-8X methylmutase [Campylobacterales bacterium]